MVKSRLYQLIYRGFELVFGILCILVMTNVLSSGGGQGGSGEFYLFFTNLSNLVVIGYVFCEFIYTLVRFLKGEKEGTSSLCLPVKFSLMIGVLLTMVVANTLLGSMMGYIFEARWWQWLTNPFLHFFNPLFFILDFALFSEVGKMKKTYPFYSLIFPLCYLVFIFIRASVLPDTYQGTIYPYPFIDVSANGWGITIGYICGLAAIFLLVGYLIYFIDHKRASKPNKK